MIINREDYVRNFYININGLDLSKKGHSWIQLCLSLEEKDIDAICITETNGNGERQHLFNSFAKKIKRYSAQRETNHLHIEHQNHMERRLQTRRIVHHIKGKTIVISNHQRTRQLGVRTLDIHHSLGKKQQQDNYIQPLSSRKYRSYVSRKQHSNKTIVDNIKTTKQKRTSTWCNHKWPNTSHQRETKKQWRNNTYHRRQ